jgi:hypothetical protein
MNEILNYIEKLIQTDLNEIEKKWVYKLIKMIKRILKEENDKNMLKILVKNNEEGEMFEKDTYKLNIIVKKIIKILKEEDILFINIINFKEMEENVLENEKNGILIGYFDNLNEKIKIINESKHREVEIINLKNLNIFDKLYLIKDIKYIIVSNNNNNIRRTRNGIF